jgi:hypothetical protein
VKPRTVARLVGGAIILFNLWLIGHYRIEGVMVLVLTFGVAVAFELLIVRSVGDGEATGKVVSATPQQAVVFATGRAPEPAQRAGPSEENWKQALAEFEGSARRDGLWGKSFAEANGDEAVAKAKYLQVRAAELAEADLSLVQEAARAAEAKRLGEEEAVRLAAQREHDAKPKGICPSCNKVILLHAMQCVNCDATFGEGAVWKVLPIRGET